MFGKIVLGVCLIINIMVFIKAMTVYIDQYGTKEETNTTDEITYRSPMISTFTGPPLEHENQTIDISQE